ncbi:ABC transporter substrate-binding protein [Parablautia intestinalis]|uniref:ABC transporter substrate-binding protein n=1 Tax=Parablautia intestinalis TaxID=2320100 RepID=UPI00259CA30D|nr:extracellular solute-binding protein [Parablautia intestinalis]
MKRKIVAVLLSAAMILSVTACGNSSSNSTSETNSQTSDTSDEASNEDAAADTLENSGAEESTEESAPSSTTVDFTGVKAEIDIDGTIIGDALTTFEAKVEEFNNLTGAQLELVENGDDHEAIMKTRMASNDMPDMFTTHGWSTIRYNEFCYDLSGESWVGDMADAAAAVVTDPNGKVCTCPLTEWIYGIAYNDTIMEGNGIDMYSIETWGDLENALQTLKDAGITPISVGGKSTGALGGFLEMSNVYYSADGAMYDGGAQLQDGTFSFVEHPEIIAEFANLYDKGFFIEDLFTADPDTARNYVAAGQASMLLWGSPEYVDLMKTANPDNEFGIIPVPAVKEGGKPAYTVGEGTAIAISSNTENLELCQAFLEFMTDPENLKEYVDSTGAVSGFTTISQDDTYSLNKYNESISKVANITYTNFFDREYLPSGMWNYMSESIAKLFNCKVGEAGGMVDEVAEYMQQAYEQLYATNNE